MYIKVQNLTINNVCDYKGLDMTKVVVGSQFYPLDENVGYFKFNGDLVEHTDIILLTKEEYEQAYQKFKNSLPISLEEKVKTQELSIANMEYILMMEGLI